MKKPNKQWKERSFKGNLLQCWRQSIGWDGICLDSHNYDIKRDRLNDPAVDITTGWQHIPQEPHKLPSLKIRGEQMFSITDSSLHHAFIKLSFLKLLSISGPFIALLVLMHLCTGWHREVALTLIVCVYLPKIGPYTLTVALWNWT